MTEPNDLADELIRRAYTDAPLPGFDVSAGLADLCTRIKKSGLLGTSTIDSRRVGTRFRGNTREKLAADLKQKYERGASIRALAESTGCSYGFVHRVLSESGRAGVRVCGRPRCRRRCLRWLPRAASS